MNLYLMEDLIDLGLSVNDAHDFLKKKVSLIPLQSILDFLNELELAIGYGNVEEEMMMKIIWTKLGTDWKDMLAGVEFQGKDKQ